MKVCEYFNVNKQDGLFGMEVEVEGANLPQEIPYYWGITKDGSLRGESAEYVFKKSYSFEGTLKAIDVLVRATKDSVLNFSHRTSVHVHVNVQQLERDQLLNFLYISYLFDRALDHIGGREISGNRFCLRIGDAEGAVEYLKKFADRADAFAIPQLGNAKYSAINIVPVAKYGSVEFRSMRGTLDKVVLKDWICIIKSLLDFSLKYATIKEMMADFLNDEQAFCCKIFPEELLPYFTYKELVSDLRMNYSLLIGVMYEAKYEGKIQKEIRNERPAEENAVGRFFDGPIMKPVPPRKAAQEGRGFARYVNYQPAPAPIANRMQWVLDDYAEAPQLIDNGDHF